MPLASELDDQRSFEDEQLDAPAEIESGARVAPESTEREIRVSGRAPAGTHEASAEAHHIDREDPLMDEFFRHPDKPVIDVWEETHPPRVMSHGSRRAMYAAIGIFAVSVIGIGSFAAYHTLVMPAPVELGASAGEETAAVLPTPLAAAPAAEPTPPAAAAPVAPAAPEAPAKTETQPSAASNPPASPTPAPPTLAEIAAREPAPEAAPTGVAIGHLIASAAGDRETADPPPARAPAAAVAAAEAQTQDPMPPIRQGSRSAAPPTYDELVAIGRSLSKKKRNLEASEAFRRALLHAPDGSAALSGLSFVYLNADDNQQAREYAQRAVHADATNAEGWIVLGAALELLGDKTGAQAAYHSCVEQGRGPYLSQCRQVARP